jgi:hypothetical protein
MRIGEAGGVLEAFVAEPEEVEADLVAGDDLLLAVSAPAPLR